MTITEHMAQYDTQSSWDFSGLSALFINTALIKSPETSHTHGLMDISAEIMRRQGVAVEFVRGSITTSPGAFGRT